MYNFKNKFSFINAIVCGAIVLCALNLSARQMSKSGQAGPIIPASPVVKNSASLEKERQKQEEGAGVVEVNLDEAKNKKFPDRYVQSQAHLQLPAIRNLIKNDFSSKVVPYFNIISSAIVKEAELKKTHYVFYHAAPSITAVLSDVFTQLYFNEHPETKLTEDNTFRFLRFQGEKQDMTAQEFLADQLSKNGLVDDSGKLGAYLLSVNLALFGNVGSKTECTWYWFINNERSVPKPDLCNAIMDQFGLSRKYVSNIMALDDILAAKESTLLQIFIPKDIVDEIVYLAWIRGVPASGPIMDWIKKYQKSKAVPEAHRKGLVHTSLSREALAEKFKKEKENNPLFRDFMKQLEAGDFSADAFLTAYCNKPYDLPNMNETEGRILFTQEGLHSPSSGIKFYRYLTTPRDKLEEYTVQLNGVVQKLISEKEAQGNTAKPAKGAKIKK